MRKDARACAGCGCRLSQYNLEDLCAACSRDRRLDVRPGPSIPDAIWRDSDIQTAIANWDFGLASRLIREQAGLRQDDMAFMTGLSQSFLSMLESGGRRLTNLEKAARFLQGIGTPDALLAPPFRESTAPVTPCRVPYTGPGPSPLASRQERTTSQTSTSWRHRQRHSRCASRSSSQRPT